MASAGTAVTLYWGGLFASRLGYAFLPSSVHPDSIIKLCIITAFVSMLALVLHVHPIVDAAAIALAGFASGPIFPSLIATTPARVGARHTANTVGLQVSIAAVGLASAVWANRGAMGLGTDSRAAHGVLDGAASSVSRFAPPGRRVTFREQTYKKPADRSTGFLRMDDCSAITVLVSRLAVAALLIGPRAALFATLLRRAHLALTGLVALPAFLALLTGLRSTALLILADLFWILAWLPVARRILLLLVTFRLVPHLLIAIPLVGRIVTLVRHGHGLLKMTLLTAL
jgi:hypothetical protein